MLPTLDPNIFIISRDKDVVEYVRTDTGETWKVSGTCNQCGLCALGAIPKSRYIWVAPIGTPFSNIDLLFNGRLDEPVLPGFNIQMQRQAKETKTATVTGCSLTIGEYL